MSDNRQRTRHRGVAVLSALALTASVALLGACDDLEPIPLQNADEKATPHQEDTE